MGAAAAGTDRVDKRKVRRILLALDATTDDMAGLDEVAALAERLQAEILGLLVEDADVFDLADHPGALVVSAVSTGLRRLDRQTVERSHRVRAVASQRAVEAAMGRRRVKAHFAVRRGNIAREVIASARDADLVVIGWGSGGLSLRASGQPLRPGAIACAVAEGAERPVLLLKSGPARGPAPLAPGPALVAYDGSPTADKAVAAAIELSLREGELLDVALLTDRLADVAAWTETLQGRLAEQGVAARFLHLAADGLPNLCALARHSGASILVLGVDGPTCCGAQVRGLLDRAECSVLLVR